MASYLWERQPTTVARGRDRQLLLAMLVGVVLSGFLGMISGVEIVSMCDMSVVPGLFVVTGLVMRGGLLVMPRGELVVFGSFMVMFGTFAVSHVSLLLFQLK